MATPAAIPPQAVQHGNQLQFVVSVLSRHRVLIFVFTILASIVGASVGLLSGQWKPAYRGTTELVVYQSELLNVLGSTPSSPKKLLDLVSKQTLSEDIARAMIQRDILSNGPRIALASTKEQAKEAAATNPRLTLEAIPDSSNISISFASTSETEAQVVTEMAARVFIDSCNRMLAEEDKDRHESITQELDDLRVKLEQAENTEWEYRQQMGFRTHDEVTEEMDRMNQELIESETKRELLNAKMQEIEAEFKGNNEQLPVALGDIGEGVVQQLRTELAELSAQELSMKVDYQPEYKPLRDLQFDIEAKKEALLAAVQSANSEITGGQDAWEDRARLREQYLKLQIDLTTLDIQTKTTEKILQDKKDHLPALFAKSLDYQKYVREAEQLRRQFEKAMDDEFETRTALRRGATQIGRKTPVAVAPLPRRASSNVWINMLMGAAIGFIVGFCLAVMMEQFDTSIRSIEDVTEYIGLDVIGTIPRMAFGKPRRGGRRGATVTMVDEDQVDACIVTQHDPKSPISEAYRTLRTKFQFATIQKRPKTVLITSAVPGEGKTTTAVNMAVTMADSGMRVLVIDTDLRRPNVHHVLRMERGPGLADVLRQGLDINSVIRPTRIKNLWIISSGRVPPNPSELIGSERMQRVLNHLKGRFDLILCDAPSVLVVTDPVLLSTFVDSTMLVVSVNNARRETILRAKQHLDAANAYIAGVVLNGLDASRRHYYYYYYYYDEGDHRTQKRWYHI
jgi:capsular exopolysaccharide synthesis family protein